MPGRGAFDFHGCRDILKKEAFPFYFIPSVGDGNWFFLVDNSLLPVPRT
jgi:hypothetical protein